MSHVFLSYARADRERARQLAEALETEGFDVWWDREVPPGKTFDQVIEQALERADKVVVLWSRRAVKSNWVRVEADEALARKILVPVLIEDVAPPFSSRRIEAAELQDWTGDPTEPEFRNLVAAIGEGGAAHRGRRREAPGSGTPPPETAPSEPRRRRLGVAVGLAVAAVLLVGGVAVVVAVLVGPSDTGSTDPVDFTPQVEERLVEDGAVPESRRAADVPGEPEAPDPPQNVTVTLRYTGDPYGCALDLSFDVAGRRFAPTSAVYVLSDVPAGDVPYAITGLIACPSAGTCSVQGNGTLRLRDGAVYDLVWQNTAYAQCQARLVESG